MASKPLKKLLDISEKIFNGVKQGQSEDAPIDIPGTHKQRHPNDPDHVTDLRTGQVEDKGNTAETIQDVAPNER